MGPHPAVAQIRRAVRAAPGWSARGTRPVVVACSGGADSLALAAAVAFEAPRAGVRAGLVTIDHGLQPDSARQAARVAAVGYEMGFDPVLTLPVRVGRAGGPEAAARTARYGALDAVASAWTADILLGHTLDDQAETVLLGLGRGSGPRSIAGMKAQDGPYLRPLLAVRRATTRAACAALGLAVWDDPHNCDPAFTRVRLRQEVLPLLDEVLHGGVAEALARTAALLGDDLEALDAAADAALAAAGSADQQRADVVNRRPPSVDHGEVDVVVLADLPRAVRTRVLRAWALAAGASSLSNERVAALAALVDDWHGQGPLDLPGGLRVARSSGKLRASRSSRQPEE